MTCVHLTKEHPSPGAAGLLHGQPGVLQGPEDTLEELLLLGVHLLHLAVTDTEQLVVKVIEPGETESPDASLVRSVYKKTMDICTVYVCHLVYAFILLTIS